jgi:hypothetical protein
MIKVTNGKQTGFVGEDKIYIGRYNKPYNLSKSPLYNPYKIGEDGDRDIVINKYREYLLNNTKYQNNSITKELNRLLELYKEKGKLELVCWCNPLACHGDIIKEYLENRDISDVGGSVK